MLKLESHSIGKFALNAYKKIESKIITAGALIDKNSMCKTAEKILAMDGTNFKTSAFIGLMFGFVLVPRIVQAQKRDNGTGDEMREIFTRDVISILTLVYAMKGLHSGITNLATKKNGLVLMKRPQGVIKGFFKTVQEYLRPEGGLDALKSSQFTPKYTKFASMDEVKGFFRWIHNEGGDLKKVLTFDGKKGGPLAKITEEVFGKDGLKGKNVDEIINAATSGEYGQKYMNLLNDTSKNPLYKSVKAMDAWFNAASLSIVTGFLGIGLPKINDVMTTRRYIKKGGEIQDKYENPTSLPRHTSPVKGFTKQQQTAFSNFNLTGMKI